jgi:hypothetical protein
MTTSAALTWDDLIDLWRRINPKSYTVPIETLDNGQGFDVPAAQAMLFESACEAVVTSFQTLYLLPNAGQHSAPASGGAKATTTLTIRRSGNASGAVTLDIGTRFRAQMLGTIGQIVALSEFESTAPCTIAAGSLGPVTVAARAVQEGTAGNLRAGSIVGFTTLGAASVPARVDAINVLTRVAPLPGQAEEDHFLPTIVGRYVGIIGLVSGVSPPRKIMSVGNDVITFDPPVAAVDLNGLVVAEVLEWETLGLTVEQTEDAVGGLTDMLGALARERGAGRRTGESDDQFRTRICNLADTVSPAAIIRQATASLSACGIAFRLLETRDVFTLKGFVYDLDAYDFGSVEFITLVGGSQLIGQGAVMLDLIDLFSMFIIEVQNAADGECGFAYDATPPSLPNPANAWDWNIAWDGQPFGYLSCISSLYAAVEAARAAGVNWYITRDLTP